MEKTYSISTAASLTNLTVRELTNLIVQEGYGIFLEISKLSVTLVLIPLSPWGFNSIQEILRGKLGPIQTKLDISKISTYSKDEIASIFGGLSVIETELHQESVRIPEATIQKVRTFLSPLDEEGIEEQDGRGAHWKSKQLEMLKAALCAINGEVARIIPSETKSDIIIGTGKNRKLVATKIAEKASVLFDTFPSLKSGAKGISKDNLTDLLRAIFNPKESGPE